MNNNNNNNCSSGRLVECCNNRDVNYVGVSQTICCRRKVQPVTYTAWGSGSTRLSIILRMGDKDQTSVLLLWYAFGILARMAGL